MYWGAVGEVEVLHDDFRREGASLAGSEHRSPLAFDVVEGEFLGGQVGVFLSEGGERDGVPTSIFP